MATDLSTAPYYDDFNSAKNYYQVLFKPGMAVQARELTQLQSILRDQIAKFGNHIFQHGSIVIPGNSISDLYVPYITTATNIVLSNFDGKVIVGSTSGVKAVVKTVAAATQTNQAALYLSYTSGSATTGKTQFSAGETVYVESAPATTAVISGSGYGSIAHINRGVYYINGTFVQVEPQTIVISRTDSLPSCHVLLKIEESLVDSSVDETLLDPAQGSYNYAAPGADRLKIKLVLTSLPLNTAITSDYVEIMRYNAGELEEHSRTPKYSELEKSMARRTFDESGNYVVSGLEPKIVEHKKIDNNGGLYVNGDSSKYVVEVSPGKAYISGFEVEKISKGSIVVEKGRTADHIKTKDVVLRPSYGQYIIVSNIVGSLAAVDRQTISFYNDNDSANASATLLGTAFAIGVEYLLGDPAASAVYKIWISDINMSGTNTLDMAGGIRFTGGSAYMLTKYNAPVQSGTYTVGEVITHSSGRTATVKYWDSTLGDLYAYRHLHTTLAPSIGDKIVGGTSTTSSVVLSRTSVVSIGGSSMVFKLPAKVVASLQNESLAYALEYSVQKELTIVTNASGVGSVTISSGVISPITANTFVALNTSGIVQNSLFSLNVNGNTLSIAGGPVSSTIKVYTKVVKTNVSPKTKTVTVGSDVVGTPGSTVYLTKSDIIGITSIIDSVGDITNNYTLNNGQTDYSYDLGSIVLKTGKPAPTGSITINYTYYTHSVSGDFFCADSYSSVSNFLEHPNTFKSSSSGIKYDLYSCLDFRPSVGADFTFTGVGAIKNDLLLPDNQFRTALKYYVPRIDSLVVDSTGKIEIVRGIPADNPALPKIPDNQFELNRFRVPEYTLSASDVSVVRMDVQRYTMKDIKNISRRVERIEEYAQLSSDESQLVSTNVIDAATGLDRFKTGYLVEKFNNPLTIANTTSADFSASFNDKTLVGSMETLNCPLELKSDSTGYVIKNGFVFLPYTETPFATQSLSSRTTNLNPFLMISWSGKLSVSPPSDSWTEVRDNPEILNETTETVTVTRFVDVPAPAPVPAPIVPPVVVTPWIEPAPVVTPAPISVPKILVEPPEPPVVVPYVEPTPIPPVEVPVIAPTVIETVSVNLPTTSVTVPPVVVVPSTPAPVIEVKKRELPHIWVDDFNNPGQTILVEQGSEAHRLAVKKIYSDSSAQFGGVYTDEMWQSWLENMKNLGVPGFE